MYEASIQVGSCDHYVTRASWERATQPCMMAFQTTASFQRSLEFVLTLFISTTDKSQIWCEIPSIEVSTAKTISEPIPRISMFIFNFVVFKSRGL